MGNQSINIVWLKRDIRSQDHEPLFRAEQAGIPYKIIYIFEPTLIKYPDTDLRHLQFVFHSILELNKNLVNFNKCVDIFYGEAIDVFEHLNLNFNIEEVFSYQESGTRITWERDKIINSFCKKQEISCQISK